MNVQQKFLPNHNESLLSLLICHEVINQNKPSRTTKAKAILVSGGILSTGLGFYTTRPIIRAAIHFSGKTLWSQVVSKSSTVGSVINFGSLASWGLFRIFYILTAPESPEMKQIQHHHCMIKVAHVGTSVIFGVLARLPSVELAHHYENGIDATIQSIASVLGEAGIPAYSMHNQLSWCAQKIKVSTPCVETPQGRALLLVKTQLLQRIDLIRSYVITLPAESRGMEYAVFYSRQMPLESEHHRIHTLFNTLIKGYHAAKFNQPQSSSCWKRGLETAIAISATMWLTEGYLMTNDVIKNEIHNSVLKTSCIAGALIPMVWVTCRATGQLAVKLTEKFTLCCKRSRYHSFSEYYYPKMDAALHVLGIGLSLLTIGSVADIAEQYASWQSTWGKLFISGNVITLNLMMVNAISDIIEKGLELYGKKCGSDDVKHAQKVHEQLSDLKTLLEKSSLLHFGRFVNSLEEQEVKDWILENQATMEDVQTYIEAKEEIV